MRKSKPIRIPVTNGLKDMFAMNMHLAYQAACVGQFNVVVFSRLAVAIAVVRTALERNNTSIPDAIKTLDKAITTLVEVRKKGDETDVWELTEGQRPDILDGIDTVEHCIGTLDVALLQQTSDNLLNEVWGKQPA